MEVNSQLLRVLSDPFLPCCLLSLIINYKRRTIGLFLSTWSSVLQWLLIKIVLPSDWHGSIFLLIHLLLIAAELRFFREAERASKRWELFEFHNITRQSASFVWEYILNLPKLLVDIRSLSPHRKVLILVKHLSIPTHKRPLPILDKLKGHKEWNWHEIREDENPRSRLLNEEQPPGWGPFVILVNV